MQSFAVFFVLYINKQKNTSTKKNWSLGSICFTHTHKTKLGSSELSLGWFPFAKIQKQRWANCPLLSRDSQFYDSQWWAFEWNCYSLFVEIVSPDVILKCYLCICFCYNVVIHVPLVVRVLTHVFCCVNRWGEQKSTKAKKQGANQYV